MVWRATDPQGNETQKVRFDVLPYMGRGGLDLGCGPHKVLEHFIGVDNGIDTDLFGIQFKPDIVLPTCERLTLFGTESVDTIFSSHLLEHIEDHTAALREWWRVLAPGGHLILYLPHADLYPNIGDPHANPDHKHDFRPEDIVAAMREAAPDWELLVNETRDQLREYSFLQVYRKTAPGAGQAEPWRTPLPEKRAAIVRPGAYGDALWASSPAAELKAQGYHVTVYTGPNGAEVLRHDPNIDRIIQIRGHWLSDTDWVLYYLWESRKYTKFVNMIGVVESRLLPHPEELPYHWPATVRHARMNRNYLEELHEHAELPARFAQRFYPAPHELEWAQAQRAQLFPGRLVVIAPTGSSLTKTWPHVQALIDALAAMGVYTLVLGEVRQELEAPEPWCAVLGKDVPIRLAMTLATLADVVVGTESAIINAAAMLDSLKVVLLSHSSPENLTKHWTNTVAVQPPASVGCHPCHRLHNGWTFCQRDQETGFAACQAAVSAEQVLDIIRPALAAPGAILRAA